MSLPPLVSIPPESIRLNIAPAEWEACLDAWISLAELYLQSPSKQKPGTTAKDNSLAEFLSSFYREVATAGKDDTAFTGQSATRLKDICFRLTERVWLQDRIAISSFDYLPDFCSVHVKSSRLPSLMKRLWDKHESLLRERIGRAKTDIVNQLDFKPDETFQKDLRRVVDLMLASPEAGLIFMTGSDFLDALVATYGLQVGRKLRKTITAAAYVGLQSLVRAEPPNLSLLVDHLYSLQTQADRRKPSESLIADLVTNTPLLSKIELQTDRRSTDRLYKLLDTLETHRSPSIARNRHRSQRRPDKGKGKSRPDDEMHMHRMSLVTQIQDLFPDLGSGFILKLLDEYDDNVEQVTAHLLEDSLPPRLRELDRIEEAPNLALSKEVEIDHLEPRSTPPLESSYFPDRHNAFDDDEFDRLEVDASRLHIGKKRYKPASGQADKAKILSALAAFDSDDDERDDTYDVEDVGGTVDTAHPDGEPGPAAKVTQEENDMALFTAYKSTPEVFGRAQHVRKGQARHTLKTETGMTDEAIEGWAIMLQRDPKRLRRLEAQAAGSFRGNQAELPRTAYRDSPAGTETEDSDAPQAPRGGFRGRGRGFGRGGGNVAGASSDPSTAAAQRRKEENKGSRANHNRRNQHAKKMARGGFAA